MESNIFRTNVGLPNLDPAELGFGKLFSPHICTMYFTRNGWSEPKIGLLNEIALHPSAVVFQYGQSIFEGFKCYRHLDDSINLFRPQMNLKRMNLSARRICMPEIDEEIVLSTLKDLIILDRDYIPSFPGSLYIRPTMIGVEPKLAVTPSTEYNLYIITSPVGGYFGASKSPGLITVYVTTEFTRASLGGTGAAKTGGNYAASMLATRKALEENCQQVLWLSAPDYRYVEELSAMNIFFVWNNTLITPVLTDTILDGITRKSIIEIAKDFMSVKEEKIEIQDLIEGIINGQVTEAIACSTAAVIAGISHLKYENNLLKIGNGCVGSITEKLYKKLIQIQYGYVQHPDWIMRIY
jgi:branched-chain amino acid aminotransferase